MPNSNTFLKSWLCSCKSQAELEFKKTSVTRHLCKLGKQNVHKMPDVQWQHAEKNQKNTETPHASSETPDLVRIAARAKAAAQDETT